VVRVGKTDPRVPGLGEERVEAFNLVSTGRCRDLQDPEVSMSWAIAISR